jgi:hypothetical protein
VARNRTELVEDEEQVEAVKQVEEDERVAEVAEVVGPVALAELPSRGHQTILTGSLTRKVRQKTGPEGILHGMMAMNTKQALRVTDLALVMD